MNAMLDFRRVDQNAVITSMMTRLPQSSGSISQDRSQYLELLAQLIADPSIISTPGRLETILSDSNAGRGICQILQDAVVTAYFESFQAERSVFKLVVTKGFHIPPEGVGHLLRDQGVLVNVGTHDLILTKVQKQPNPPARPLRLVGKRLCYMAGEVIWWYRWHMSLPDSFEIIPPD